jgi:hypothetical protein
MSPEHRTSLDLAEETLLTAPAVARPGRMPTPTDERPAVVHPFVRRFGAGASGGAIDSAVAERESAPAEPAGGSPEPWEAAARTEEEEIVEISTLLATEDAVDDPAPAPADDRWTAGPSEADLEESGLTYGDAGDSSSGDRDAEHASMDEVGPLGSALPPMEADAAPGPVGAVSSDRAWLETLDWDGDLAVVTGATQDGTDTAADEPAPYGAENVAADDDAGGAEQDQHEAATWRPGDGREAPEYAADADPSGDEFGSATDEEPEAIQVPGLDSGWSEHGAAGEESEPGVTEIADLLVAPEEEDGDAADREGSDVQESGSAVRTGDDAPPTAESESRYDDTEPRTGAPDEAVADAGAEAAIRSSLAEASAAMARAPGAMPEAFSGVFDEVADRLDNIADSMRRRSRGEAAPSRGSDPLELLLTGFVLGYVSRQGSEPRPPTE